MRHDWLSSCIVYTVTRVFYVEKQPPPPQKLISHTTYLDNKELYLQKNTSKEKQTLWPKP
jgi:hypothetical protein